MTPNLYDLFCETVRRQPSRPAILGPGSDEQVSYRQLDDAIIHMADHLERSGVRLGSCVGLHCRSGLEYIVATYAVWRCGGCVVPLAVELKPNEKQEILRTIAVQFVITEKRFAAFAEPFRQGSDAAVPPNLCVVPVKGRSRHPAGFHDINSAFIRFTSGTTSSAKGVVLSHETIRERFEAANDVLHIGPDDRVAWLLSMAYHFAVTIVGYLTFGAGIVLLPNHFAPATLEGAKRHRATLIYGSPLHYAWLASSDQAAPIPSLRLAISTTTALDRPTATQFQERYGLPLTQALGIIEIGLPFINTSFPDRVDAVGRLLPAYRLRLDDVGLGRNLQEVLLAGKGFLDAYYEPFQPRASIMPDGWFRTGDIGKVDSDGCLYLLGRSKDVIDVRGMKFFPQEVEQVLTGHPMVQAAGVYACRDIRFGEVPHARIVLKDAGAVRPGDDELRDWCRRRLAEFKVPQQFEYVDSLPRTASGKVLRRHFEPAEVQR